MSHPTAPNQSHLPGHAYVCLWLQDLWEDEDGGHVLWDTTSLSLRGLVRPSRTCVIMRTFDLRFRFSASRLAGHRGSRVAKDMRM